MSPEEIQRLRQLAKENGLLEIGSAEEIEAALNSQRRKILLPGDGRELIHFAQECGDELAARDFYRRDRTPVGINRERARLDMITPQALRTMAQRHLVFFKFKDIGTGKDATTIDIVKTMNVDTARGLLESWEFIDKLPEIERVNPIRMPIRRADDRIELAPVGYFTEGRIYTLEEVEIDQAMTYDRGQEVIADLLSEFPFHDDGRSKAVQIAAMLTVFCACMLPKGSARPGFIYTANDSDAGKTLAAKVAIIPVHGKANGRAFPRKEEMRKVLDSLAMEAATTILFDNIKGSLGGEDIEAFMSASRWKGRILGESGNFEVDNVTTCFFTGNDSRPTRDMAQRSLFVELFLEDIDSSKRTIKRFLTDRELAKPEMRAGVVSALWAMVRHWDAQGRPPALARMPKCPEWSETVGAIVACCGFGDPCAKPNIKSARTGANHMQELVKHLWKENAPATSVNETMELGAEGPVAGVKAWLFADIMEEVKKHRFFESLEIHGKKKEDVEEMFDGEGNLTMAARSFFGRFLASFDGRLFVGELGERLRWVVDGKGNQRQYLVRREGEVGGGNGENHSSVAS